MLAPSPAFLRARPVGAASARVLTAPGGHRVLRALDLPARDAFEALLTALDGRRSTEATQCAGWTVHHLLAHLAAGSAEIADLADQVRTGVPVRPTRGFDERERPYVELAPGKLRRRFVAEAMRATAAVLDLTASDADLPFTGVALAPPSLLRHAEAELVLHRWDLTGDDEVSLRALGDPNLLRHTVATVATMQPRVIPFQYLDRPASPAVVLRAEGQDDVVLNGPTVALASAPPGAPVVHLHPAARVLLLWGRTSTGELPAPEGDRLVVDAVRRALVGAAG